MQALIEAGSPACLLHQPVLTDTTTVSQHASTRPTLALCPSIRDACLPCLLTHLVLPVSDAVPPPVDLSRDLRGEHGGLLLLLRLHRAQVDVLP